MLKKCKFYRLSPLFVFIVLIVFIVFPPLETASDSRFSPLTITNKERAITNKERTITNKERTITNKERTITSKD